MITSCRDCFYFEDCGGREGNLDLFGCHLHSREQCAANQWTCPWCRTGEFTRRISEVGGWPPPLPASVLGITRELPAYVPNVEHAYNMDGRMRLPIVALPTRMVVSGRGKKFGPKFKTSTHLRREFHLERKTDLILVSVSADQYLESFWRYHRENNIAKRLANLGIMAITVPNFSYFSDGPRPHTIYNRGRINRCIERLSEAGVAVVPHLNALTTADWGHWRHMLREFPDVRYVCKEFQTHDGSDDLAQLARLQDDLKRPLHPVLVGAGAYASRLRNLFAKSTIISSTPWFRAVRGRERAQLEDGRLRWTKANVPRGHALCKLVEHNLREYTKYITMCVSGDVPAQLDFLDAFTARANSARLQSDLLWYTKAQRTSKGESDPTVQSFWGS